MSGSEDSEEIIGKDEFIVWLQARLTTSEQARQTAEARADLNFNRAERAGIRAKKHQAAKEQAEARVETLSAALDKTTAEWADMKAAKEQADAKLAEAERKIWDLQESRDKALKDAIQLRKTIEELEDDAENARDFYERRMGSNE